MSWESLVEPASELTSRRMLAESKPQGPLHLEDLGRLARVVVLETWTLPPSPDGAKLSPAAQTPSAPGACPPFPLGPAEAVPAACCRVSLFWAHQRLQRPFTTPGAIEFAPGPWDVMVCWPERCGRTGPCPACWLLAPGMSSDCSVSCRFPGHEMGSVSLASSRL